MPVSTRVVTSVNDCVLVMMFKSTSGTISNKRKTSSSISRCWAVTHTVVAMAGAAERNAATTGAILIVSGRVPMTAMILSGAIATRVVYPP